MPHAKVALVDGGWWSVSSFNLDLFGGTLNLKSGVTSGMIIGPAPGDSDVTQLAVSGDSGRNGPDRERSER